MHPFTPRWPDGERAEMAISDEESAEIKCHDRTPGWEVAVTDLITGKRYLVRQAECDQPGCGCDAVVVREMASN